jgi:hypothetical protein
MAASYSTWTEYSDIQKLGSEVQFESIGGMRAGAMDGSRTAEGVVVRAAGIGAGGMQAGVSGGGGVQAGITTQVCRLEKARPSPSTLGVSFGVGAVSVQARVGGGGSGDVFGARFIVIFFL